MSVANCVVSREFRGAVLFLVSADVHGFVWSADRANAVRVGSGEGLALVKRFEDWMRGDPAPGVCKVLDPKGHAIGTKRGAPAYVDVQAQAARLMGEARNAYVLTDGNERGEVRMMNADEYEAAQEEALRATDGTWYWVLA